MLQYFLNWITCSSSVPATTTITFPFLRFLANPLRFCFKALFLIHFLYPTFCTFPDTMYLLEYITPICAGETSTVFIILSFNGVRILSKLKNDAALFV